MILGVKNHIKQVFADFPKSELWRFFIDEFRQDEGKFAFDTGLNAEFGYCASMEFAWEKMIKEVDLPLTLEYMQLLQWAATSRLSRVQSNVLRVEGDPAHGFSLLSEDNPWERMAWNCTVAGISEFILSVRENEVELRKNKQNYYFSLSTNDDVKTIGIDEICSADTSIMALALEVNAYARIGRAKLMLKGDAKATAEKIIENYHNALQLSNSSEQVLIAIAKCIGQLERLHVFRDGNCRTMILTLNKMLLQNRLLPTILENPNRMDMLSTEELVQQIQNGQKRFLQCCIPPFLLQELQSELSSPQVTLGNYFFEKDFILTLSQLDLVYKRISEQKLRFHNNTRGIKAELQKIYLERFNNLLACLEYYKKNNLKYQFNHEKLLDTWSISLSDVEQGIFEKAAFLAKRTPVKIQWIETCIFEFFNKHSKIINHTSQGDLKSELAELFAQYATAQSAGLLNVQQQSKDKKIKRRRTYRKSWSGYPKSTEALSMVEQENNQQTIQENDPVFTPAKKIHSRARAKSQDMPQADKKLTVDSIILPMRELRFGAKNKRHNSSVDEFGSEAKSSNNAASLVTINENEVFVPKESSIFKTGSQKK